MTLTIDLLKSWYNQFNEEFFNNSLPQNSKILFRIKRTKKALGTCTCGFMLTPTISISDYFMRDEHDFKCTLIHEMIHLSEYCQSKTMGHGAFFKRECKRILQISNGCYVIQTRSDIKPVKVNNKYDTPIYQPIIMYQNSFSHHIILPTNINMPSIEKYLKEREIKYIIGVVTDRNLISYYTKGKKRVISCQMIGDNYTQILNHIKANNTYNLNQ